METLPPVSKEELDMAAALKDDDIDCSDIPEINTLSGLRPRPAHAFSESEKVAVTCNLDADIAAWLKQTGGNYQIRINSILRQEMVNAH
jgi:uncharacterized protein (DUF4415 family)